MNKVFICGHLGQDPELRTTQSGTSVTQLRVATSERRKDKSGDWTDHTEWHSVVVWDKVAEVVAKNCSKGSKITVEGRLQTRQWKDKDGNERYSTEIVADKVEFMSAGNGNGNGRGRDDDRDRDRNRDRDRGKGGRSRDDDRGGRGRDDDRDRGGRDRDRGKGGGRSRDDDDTY